MSEFKFACPVCGQHITAAASSSGKEISCPTCFRSLVVPQAPASADSKLILSAVEANKSPTLVNLAGTKARKSPDHSKRNVTLKTTAILLVVVCSAAALWYFRTSLKESIFPRHTEPKVPAVEPAADAHAWSLELPEEPLTDAPAVGKIHGRRFTCDHATFQGGALSFLHVTEELLDSSLTIYLYARNASHLSGKSLRIEAVRAGPRPRVVLAWKTGQQPVETEVVSQGYALQLSFGELKDGFLPGSVFLSLPDEKKSYVVGSFKAEVIPVEKAKGASSTNEGR